MSFLQIVALVVSLCTAVAVSIVSNASPAFASAALGDGGDFVPLQAALVNTTTGLGGYSAAMPVNTWEPVAVEGAAGLPSDGISAVQLTITAVNPSAKGDVAIRRAQEHTSVTALVYDWGTGGTNANTVIQSVGSDGNIWVTTTASTDLRIDVQGYYTAGDPDAGGYVPVTPTRMVDTGAGTGLSSAGKLAAGSSTTITAAGVAGIPASASAVFVNLQVSGSSVDGSLTAYDTGGAVPNTSLSYEGSTTTSLGASVPLSSSGQYTIKIDGSASVSLTVDVVGYFTATALNGSFTPAVARVADVGGTSSQAIPANGTVSVQVAGVAGVPAAGAGIGAVSINVHLRYNYNASGYATIWPADQTEPTFGSSPLSPNTTTSNLYTTQLSANGFVKIHNVSSNPLGYSIDVEGWYTSATGAVPSGQYQTQQSITVQGSKFGSGSYAAYKYRVGTTGSFANIPVGMLKDGSNNSPAGWPVSKTSGAFTAYTWNIRQTLVNANGSAPDSLVQVEACYDTTSSFTNPVCAMPDNIEFSQSGLGSATENVGPGTVSLLTGDLEIDESDADLAGSLDGLSVGRSLTTLAPPDAGVAPGAQRTDPSGVFGPAWTADLSGASDAASLRVGDNTGNGYLIFTDADGTSSTYQAITPVGTYPVSFAGTGDNAADGVTVTKASATSITMADSDGTITTWTKSGSTWQTTSVVEPGSNSTTTYSYNGAGLVTRILAPVPAGVSCSSAPDTTVGCRSLTLTYQSITVSGTSLTRLQKISVSLPQTSGTSSITDVQTFDYNTSAQLIDAFDPRISPNLKTAYTYNTAGRLATLTPAGLNAFTLGYDSTGRLSTISRPDPSGSTAVTTLVYGLPISGSSAPVTLDAATTGTWDQISDLPVTGTAVFPPTRQPAGTTAASVTSGDWPYAALHYLDVNGLEVNTAAYGAGAWQIDTTQYDSDGNDVWDLSAGNRVQALSPTSSTDSYVAGLSTNVKRAAALASSTDYNPLDPSQQLETFGPTHPMQLSSGATLHGQSHSSTTYDDGAPNSDIDPVTGAAYGLTTSVVTDAYDPTTGKTTSYPDAATSVTGYDAISSGDTTGWSLYQPTSQTTQMGANPGSADLTTYTRYDSSGRTIETRLPGDAAGTGPRTTDTTYYTAIGSGSCVSATLAGQVCSTAPGGQPATGKPLPVVTYGYNRYYEPVTKTETYGTGSNQVVRTTTDTFDTAGRPSAHAIAVTPSAAGGTTLPSVTYGYDTTTGLPTTASTGSGTGLQQLTNGYDVLGRISSYTDAGGVTAAYTYDLASRPATKNDGKTTVTYTYDSSSEHRGLITAESIGVAGSPSDFTAGYTADGQLSSLGYPNGLTATTRYDNSGFAATLAYAKGGSTWMTFSQAQGSFGQVMTQSSPQSSQNFSYDPADRLTKVQDTYSSACTTRAYSYDNHSNRTNLKTNPSATGGACSNSTTATNTSYGVDDADRLSNDTTSGTTNSYAYDSLGRATTVPAADAKGTGSHTSIAGDLTLSYYANDLVVSEAQGSAIANFTLDPQQNRVVSRSEGSKTTTDHYDPNSDSPSWIATQVGSTTTWTDYLADPSGAVAATLDQTGTVTLQLRNLHGDIVATCADSTGTTGVASYAESNEFGAPRNPSMSFAYGWLGAAQRSSDNLGGVIAMGVRTYSTSTGRFSSVDPIASGNDNAYVYPADPINNEDLSGQSACRSRQKTVKGSGNAFRIRLRIHFCYNGKSVYNRSWKWSWTTDGCFDFGLGGCWSHTIHSLRQSYYAGPVDAAWFIDLTDGWTGEASKNAGSYRTETLCTSFAVFSDGSSYVQFGHAYSYVFYAFPHNC